MRCADCKFAIATRVKPTTYQGPRGLWSTLLFDDPLERVRVEYRNAYVGKFWCKFLPQESIKSPDDWCGQFKQR